MLPNGAKPLNFHREAGSEARRVATTLECGLADLGRRVRGDSLRVDMVGFVLRYTQHCLDDRTLRRARGGRTN
jgi:hypothetical protein